MDVRIISPAPRGSRSGNRVAAERWGSILRRLGHRVVIDDDGCPVPCDLVVALHARRSASAVARYRRALGDVPLVVALTGTDLYRDLRHSAAARRTLEAADRIVTLQPLASREVPTGLRRRVRVIHQSVPPLPGRRRTTPRREFRVAVVAHLRAVKDPFRAALAVRGLPAASRIRVVHAGRALTPAMERRARDEQRLNPRWRWLGERSRTEARRLMRDADVVVLSSRLEGGAHVVSEAAVDGVAVIASRIPGTVGLLGRSYPGYFGVGDTAGLRALLRRAEIEPRFVARLRRAVAAKAPLFDPRREAAAWRALISGLDRSSRKPR